MQMKIGILGWDDEEEESVHLEECVANLGQQSVRFTLDDVTCGDRGGRLDVLIRGTRAEELDVIVSRAQLRFDRWHTDLEKLTLLSNLDGVPMIDPADAFVAAESKLIGMQRLAQAGLRVPPTTQCWSVAEVHALWRTYGRIVLKPSFGFSGQDVERVDEDFDGKNALIDGLLQRYGSILVQPFLPHPQGDMRVTVVGRDVGFSFRRIPPPGKWKANVSKGAMVAPYTPTPRVREVALVAARTMGITIAGVDIIELDGEYVILEINNVPGWWPLWPEAREAAGLMVAQYAMRRAAGEPASNVNLPRGRTDVRSRARAS